MSLYQNIKIIKFLNNFTALFFLIFFLACHNESQKLPIYGEKIPHEVNKNGIITTDTIYQTIPNFSFINQDSAIFTEQNINNKIYVADFFFTKCPSICPVMKKQMLRVYKKFEGNDDVKFLSHTIDPKHDSISVLKNFEKKLGVNGKQWIFLYGNRDSVYSFAKRAYLSIAYEDKLAPGGIVHSGYFILVDKQKRIRGAYDGTSSEQVSQLIKDIDILLKEYE